MMKAMRTAEEYAEIIIRDTREKIKNEMTTFYTEEKIERVYEFHDGAIVKYEWQSVTAYGKPYEENFNHRFSLITLPVPNPHNFKKGLIKVINSPQT
jgi:hypothetical protein